MDALPRLIQGGMAVGISTWRLARAVSQLGQLGVVAGTGLSAVLVGRLMDGDLGGYVHQALGSLPLGGPVQAILDRYYRPGGKPPDEPYRTPPAYTVRPPRFLDQLTALATYVEVFLAKQGHAGLIGINLLEKVQMPTLASLYGAMLAGVDFVLMGAGIPTQVPAILDKLACHEPVSYRLDVRGAGSGSDHRIHFDPSAVFAGVKSLVGQLRRPRFLPIISSAVLGQALLKRSTGVVDGFVVEGPSAGGHNAPPRGPLTLNDRGEPIYGSKDLVDLQKIARLGRPFWLAGGYGNPAQAQAALEAGAAGVQVGTAFALCDESGMDPALKMRLLRLVAEGKATVLTSAVASPTGFPFKVAQVEGTVSEPDVYRTRPRHCDLGFLRSLFQRENGSLGYRCAAEPVVDYVRKGGQQSDTFGRICLCNQLMATAGYPRQRKDGYIEPPIVTAGDDLTLVARFLRPGRLGYTAADVVHALLGQG